MKNASSTTDKVIVVAVDGPVGERQEHGVARGGEDARASITSTRARCTAR